MLKKFQEKIDNKIYYKTVSLTNAFNPLKGLPFFYFLFMPVNPPITIGIFFDPIQFFIQL